MRLRSRRFAVVATGVVTAFLALAVWIVADTVSRAPGEKYHGRALDDAKGNRPLDRNVEIGPSGLAIPVSGVKAKQLVDSYAQHDGLDILALAGTPVVAAGPGHIERLDVSPGADGITASIRSDDARWVYYYAHLEGYAPGLKKGQRVERGQVIGRVGSTGSASPRGPHLHFEIRRMSEAEPWSQGRAVNPYPLLTGRGS